MANEVFSVEPLAQAAGWSLATIAFYLLAKRVYGRWPHWWLMPLNVAPALLLITALVLHESYRDYIRAAGWLVALLGPATVAFAVPIYEQRALIHSHWPLLLVGTVVGSTTGGQSTGRRWTGAPEPTAAFDQHSVRGRSLWRDRRHT